MDEIHDIQADANKEQTDALTKRQRDCMDLYYEAGLTVVEIGKRLGINHGNVSRNIHAAKRIIRGLRPRTINMQPADIDRLDLRRIQAVM